MAEFNRNQSLPDFAKPTSPEFSFLDDLNAEDAVLVV